MIYAKVRWMAAALTASWLAATAGLGASGSPEVSVAQGALRGSLKDGVESFLGIPYAAPPVGERRWKAPASPAVWTGARDATRFGSNCFQSPPVGFGPYTPEFLVDDRGTEDCLYLNVWTPAARNGRLPVLVWVHGGGYSSGSASIPIYNGSSLASRGSVVVGINYRLGILGMLAHPELTAESPDKTSGNYTLQDMIAALRWVHDNIAKFGGDPANVTIVGQSAGASAVNNLVMSPAAKGLFHRVIAETGSSLGAGGISAPTLAEAEAVGKSALQASGFTSIAAARAAPPEKVWDSRPPSATPAASGPTPSPFRPVIDGKILVANPGDVGAPVQSKVPQMTGSNNDESGVSLTARVTPKAFDDTVRQRYGAAAERILALYPHANEDEASASSNTLARDRALASTYFWSRAREKASGQHVYNYLFVRQLPGPGKEKFGAFHTAEVPYVFGALVGQGRDYTAEDRAVSALTQHYWLNFMRTGNPNGAGLAHWPAVSEGQVMAIDVKPAARPVASTPERLAALKAYFESGGPRLD